MRGHVFSRRSGEGASRWAMPRYSTRCFTQKPKPKPSQRPPSCHGTPRHVTACPLRAQMRRPARGEEAAGLPPLSSMLAAPPPKVSRVWGSGATAKRKNRILPVAAVVVAASRVGRRGSEGSHISPAPISGAQLPPFASVFHRRRTRPRPPRRPPSSTPSTALDSSSRGLDGACIRGQRLKMASSGTSHPKRASFERRSTAGRANHATPLRGSVRAHRPRPMRPHIS